MKRIEDIEKLSAEALERIADDKSVDVPSSLEGKLLSGIMAMELSKEEPVEKKPSRIRKIVFSATSFAMATAAAIAIIVNIPRGPKDTFNDPVLAYAALEGTLSYIGSKMERGMEIASMSGVTDLNKSEER